MPGVTSLAAAVDELEDLDAGEVASVAVDSVAATGGGGGTTLGGATAGGAPLGGANLAATAGGAPLGGATLSGATLDGATAGGATAGGATGEVVGVAEVGVMAVGEGIMATFDAEVSIAGGLAAVLVEGGLFAMVGLGATGFVGGFVVPWRFFAVLSSPSESLLDSSVSLGCGMRTDPFFLLAPFFGTAWSSSTSSSVSVCVA